MIRFALFNPDPNKCYVRSVTPDVYESETRDYLTYTREEANKFAHVLREIEISPETSQWETTTYEGCESDNPNDCQVLCYRTYPAVYDTIYEPLLDDVGSPSYREIEWKTLVKKGGLSSYSEIDCAFTSYQSLPSYSFAEEGFMSPDGERVIRETILKVLDDNEGLRLQFLYRFGGDVPETNAEMLENYLVDKGVNPNSLVFQHQPDERYAEGTFEVFWRVLNIDY